MIDCCLPLSLGFSHITTPTDYQLIVYYHTHQVPKSWFNPNWTNETTSYGLVMGVLMILIIVKFFVKLSSCIMQTVFMWLVWSNVIIPSLYLAHAYFPTHTNKF